MEGQLPTKAETKRRISKAGIRRSFIAVFSTLLFLCFIGTSWSQTVHTYNPSSGSTDYINSTISGSDSIVKNGLGQLTIQVANTFTGGSSFNLGTIMLNHEEGLGTWVAADAALSSSKTGLVLVTGTTNPGINYWDSERKLVLANGNYTLQNRFLIGTPTDKTGRLDLSISSNRNITIQNVINTSTTTNWNVGGAISIFSEDADPFRIVGSSGATLLFQGNKAGYGGAIGVYVDTDSTLNFAPKSTQIPITFSGNEATQGDGGAIYINSKVTPVTFGDNTNFVNNTAYARGGALGIYTNRIATTIGKNTYFANNAAGTTGGAIDMYMGYLVLQGNTFFHNNTASDNGGAIHIQNGSVCEFFMDTTSGHIAFQGNTANGIANAMHLQINSRITVQGSNNVYFDDPITGGTGGNSLILDGTGIVQFASGNSVLAGEVNINSGTLRFAQGTTFKTEGSGGNYRFNLNSGTLAGAGHIISSGGIYLKGGTVSPDKDVFATPTYNPITSGGNNKFGMADTTPLAANKIATMTFEGSTYLQGATFQIDIDSSDITNYDKFIVDGYISFSGNKSTVNITHYAIGTFDLFTATGAILNDPKAWFNDVLINGGTLRPRYGAQIVRTSDNKILQLKNSFLNIESDWRGNVNGNWNKKVNDTTKGTENWRDSTSTAEDFMDGDKVTFGSLTSSNRTIAVIAGGVAVADMTVLGTQDYTFSGGSITGTTSGTTLTDVTGKLMKSGSSTLTLNNENEFQGGIELSGGTIVLGTNKSLGTWVTSDPLATSRYGMVTAEGVGAGGTIQVLDNRTLTNRFQAGTQSNRNGRFVFDIANGKILTITGVENTSTNAYAGAGGAIGILAHDSNVLTFTNGHFVLTSNKATYGGAVGSNLINNSVVSFLGLQSLKIMNNQATQAGGAVALRSQGTTSLTFGNMITATENTSAGSGGAIDLTGSDNTLVFDTNTYFWKNTGATDGGAINMVATTWNNELTLKGNTFFSQNSASTGKGGAISMDNGTEGILTLDTSAGHIAFTGNKVGSITNSIHFDSNVAVSVTGNNNIYFNDPVSAGSLGGNTLTMNGSGIVQFDGSSIFNVGTGGTVVINAGTFRLADGAAFTTRGSQSTFTLNTGGTLAGGGTLTALRGFNFKGIISLDADTLATPTYNTSTLTFGTADTNINSSKIIGTMTLVGDSKFDGVTLKINLSADGVTTDKFVSVGNVTVGLNINTIDLQNYVLGTFDLIDATDYSITAAASDFQIKLNNGSLSQRQGAEIINTGEILKLHTFVNNIALIWTGTTNGNWDTTLVNWKDITNAPDQFYNGDRVLFDATGSNSTILVTAGGMVVADMEVEGNQSYTFNGGSITADQSQSSLSDATGKLKKSGTGVLTFNNANEFLGGIELSGGGIVLGNNKSLGTWQSGDPAADKQGMVSVIGSGSTGKISTPDNRTITNRFQVGSETDRTGALQIAINASKTLTIENVENLSTNNNLGTGGAIGIHSNNANALAISGGHLVMDKNKALFGGAIGANLTTNAMINLTSLESVTLTRNEAANAGGAISFHSSGMTSLTFGNLVTVTGNQAGTNGGAIDMSGTSNTLTFGTNTYFQGNTATTNGGGISMAASTGANNLSLLGNTFFSGNSANGKGGAIALDNATTGTLVFDTSAGIIAFTGNTAVSGTANAVHLEKNVAVNVSGSNNIYFNDPLSSGSGGGNSLTVALTGTGLIQFNGESVLNATGVSGGAVNVNTGTFRVVNGAKFTTWGDQAKFTLGSAGGLAGAGTIVAQQGFEFKGTIALDSDTLSTPAFSTSDNTFAAANNTTNLSLQIGTLNLVGNSLFDGAKLNIDLAAGNVSDQIVSTGNVSFSGTNSIDITTFVEGTFNLIDATGYTMADIAGKFSAVTFGNGNTLPLRQGADLIKTGNILQLRTEIKNLVLTWHGTTDGNWNTTTENWKDSNSASDKFMTGDHVVFKDGLTTNRTIEVVAGGVTVADMEVQGNEDYIFNGGSITAQTTGTTLTSPTAKLKKSGTGTLTLNNENEFDGGIDLKGGTIVIGNNKALGTWQSGNPATVQRGMVTVTGASGSTIQVDSSKIVTNRFLIGTNSERTGSLDIDIATNQTLTVTGVLNTSTDSVVGFGGAIGVLSHNANALTFQSGNLVLEQNKARSGGAVGVALNQNASFNFSGLQSLTLTGNESNMAGGAVAIDSTGTTSLTFGTMTTITDNKAGTSGGAINMSGTFNTLVFDEKTHIKGNISAGNGGAINMTAGTGSNTLLVKGNTYFAQNSSGGRGGAIYFGNNANSLLTLDTTDGQIAFSGNTATGSANALHLEKNVAINVVGNNNVYFDDPISSGSAGGNSLTKNGDGFIQFVGNSTLSIDNNGKVDINSGIFRVVNGSNFTTRGDAAKFTLNSSASLQGAGTITAEKGFEFKGIISLDSDRLTTPAYDPGTNTFSPATTAIDSAYKIGTVILVGNSVFNNATLKVDLAAGNVSDKITTTGNVSFVGTVNHIDIATFEIGTFTLIDATGHTLGDFTGKFNEVTLDGAALTLRQGATLLRNGNMLQLQTFINNVNLTWIGNVNGNWDTGTQNWKDFNTQADYFIAGDRVIFDDNGTNTTVSVVAGGVTVADMVVSGTKNYTIGGGKITAQTTGTSLTDAKGQLQMSGSGVLALNGENEFTGGILLSNGTIRLGHDKALGAWQTGNPTVAKQGMVTVAGTGNEGTIETDIDREITNRFQIGTTADRTGTLKFDVATGTLTVKDVKNTSSDANNGSGGAIGILSHDADALTLTGKNLVFSGNEAYYGGAIGANTTQNTAMDLSGMDSLKIMNNKASFSGGGISVRSTGTTSLTLGTMTSMLGNTAGTNGGAVDMTGTSNTLVLDTNTYFRGNSAGTNGGAINMTSTTGGNDLTVNGNTFFTMNSAVSRGGGITMNNANAGTLTLDATNGNIGFSGNTASGSLNAIHLEKNVDLVITGGNNVYFDDPISSGSGGNSLTKNGNGFVQFNGSSVLNGTGVDGGEVNINAGTFRVISGANFTTRGNDAVFTLGSSGTLSGGGTITAENGFEFYGKIALDNDRLLTPTFNQADNTFGSATVIVDSLHRIGTMTLVGSSIFDGATMDIDLAASNVSDKIIATGDVSFGPGLNTVNITTFQAGLFTLIDATGFTLADIAGKFNAVTVNGGALSHRQGTDLIKNGSLLQLHVYNSNIELTWTGSIDGTWNSTVKNWVDASSDPDNFIAGDRTIFDDSGSNTSITVASAGVIVADMIVASNQDYDFTGGGITASSSESTLSDAKGKLVKSGTGTLILRNENEFHGGIDLQQGTIEIANSKALGTWTAGNPASTNRGMVTIAGIGADGTIEANGSHTITNRFQVGEPSERTGKLTFAIASGETLTVTGVENTSNDTTLSTGGAIGVFSHDSDALTFTGGSLNINASKARYGGAIGINLNQNATFDFSTLEELKLTSNEATIGGGAIAVRSTGGNSLTLGTMTTINDNTAGGSGGGIDMSGTSNALVFDENTYMKGNMAGSNGGAVSMNATAGSNSLTVVGNSFFSQNSSLGRGGAIYMNNTATSTLTFNTAAGDIAFSNNTAIGSYNAVHLEKNVGMTIEGANNIYFDDPITTGNSGGNSLTMNSTGIVQFNGQSVLSMSNGGAVNINSGTFRVVKDASFTTRGDTAKFTLGSTATLSGGGTISAEKGFDFLGTISLDSDRFTTPDYQMLTNTFDTVVPVLDSAKKIGTMTLTGNALFNNVKMDVDLASGNISDKIIMQGNVTFAGAGNTINITSFEIGLFNLVDATGFTLADISGKFNAVTINGSALSYRQGADLIKNGNILQLNVFVNNINLIWNGSSSGNWDRVTSNWQDLSNDPEYFADGDRVTFNDIGAIQNISVIVGDVSVADMIVDGTKNYTFGGGGITAKTTGTTIIGATGKLIMSGSGVLTLNNANNFLGGIELNDGTIVLGNDLALGTWQTGDAAASKRGMVEVIGTGSQGGIKVDISRNIANRFQVGSAVDRTGELQFDILSSGILTISGVENTSTNDYAGTGGGIGVLSHDANNLTFTGGSLAVTNSKARYGGAIGVNLAQDAALDLSVLNSLLLTGNESTLSGGAVAMRSTGTNSLTMNRMTTMTGNTANASGGAIDLAGTNNVAMLGSQSYFHSNHAGAMGGAINLNATTGTSSLIVQGNTFFSQNNAINRGGAIAASSAASGGSLTFDTTLGHIAMTGNTASGISNSVYLEKNTALNVTGDNNVYFDDPILSGGGGNSMAMNGKGIIQFVGNSTLNNSGQNGGAININDGTFRLVTGNSFVSRGNDALFTLANDATLAGGGTITAEQGFVLSGTIALDADRLTTPTFDPLTNTFGTANTSINSANAIGTVTLVGNTTFSGAGLEIDLKTGNFSDKIVVTGTVTYGATKNSINIGTFETGVYDIITSSGAMGDIAGMFNDITVGGLALGGRQSASLSKDGNTVKLTVQTKNLDLTWIGTTNIWDTTATGNWVDDVSDPEVFNVKDYVIFDATGGMRNIVVGDGTAATSVQVSGMEVHDSYEFSGGGIRGVASPSFEQTSTGRLDIFGAGTVVGFSNQVNFDEGMTIETGATAVLKDGGSFSDMDIVNDGTLTFNRSTGNDNNFDGDISGTGQLVKTGTGIVTLGGENTYSGGTTITQGTLVGDMKSLQGDIFIDTAGMATFHQAGGSDGTYSGELTGTGVLRKAGSGKLTIGEDSTLFDGEVQVQAGTFALADDKTLASDHVVVENVSTLDLGRNSTLDGAVTVKAGGHLVSGAEARITGNLDIAGDVTPDKNLYVDGIATFENGSIYNATLVANPSETYSGKIIADSIVIDSGVSMKVNDIGVLSSYVGRQAIRFNVLETQLGIRGNFTSVTGFNSLFNAEYGIDGNDYYIQVTLKNMNPFDDYADNNNTQEVTDGLNDALTDPDLKDLIDEFTDMTDDEIRDFIDQLRGTELAAAAQASVMSSPWLKVYRTMDFVDAPDYNPLFARKRFSRIRSQSMRHSNRNTWGESFYRYMETKTDGNAVSYNEKRGGMMVGMDTDYSSRFKAGVAFGYSNPLVASRFGNVDVDDYILAVYTRARVIDNYYANMFFGGGIQRYDYTRKERSDYYTAKYDGQSIHTSLEFYRPIRYRYTTTFYPILGLDYQHAWTDGFREKNGPFAQRIEETYAERMTMRMGLAARYYQSLRFDMTARLEYGVQILGDEYSMALTSFAASQKGKTMSLRGVELGPSQITAALGAKYWLRENMLIYSNYDFDYSKRTYSHTGQIGTFIQW